MSPPPAALTLPYREARATPRVTSFSAPPGPRFTLDGSRELEQHLALTCAKIAAGLRGLLPSRRLEGVLLGGGYGRGEGGVLRTEDGDRPYNDLEFYVYLRGNRHLNELRYGRALHVLGEILTPQAGLEVEFKIASLRELSAAPTSMFSYDLLCGHRWLVGEERLLASCTHHRRAASIPLHEATRLLMNRCSGLLFARERMEKNEFTAADADFVRRNIAKAQLALGDALLVALGRYHWSVLQRQRELSLVDAQADLPELAELRRHHAIGVEFKLHPVRSAEPRERLREEHAEVAALAREVWLWIEARRLGRRFATPAEYALSPQPKCPEAAPLRTALINLRHLGLAPLRQGRGLRHPRERIFHALALLLWEPATLDSHELRGALQRELRTPAQTFPAAMAAYRSLWSRVN